VQIQLRKEGKLYPIKIGKMAQTSFYALTMEKHPSIVFCYPPSSGINNVTWTFFL
jgi:hypothetical protein